MEGEKGAGTWDGILNQRPPVIIMAKCVSRASQLNLINNVTQLHECLGKGDEGGTEEGNRDRGRIPERAEEEMDFDCRIWRRKEK